MYLHVNLSCILQNVCMNMEVLQEIIIVLVNIRVNEGSIQSVNKKLHSGKKHFMNVVLCLVYTTMSILTRM